MTIDAALTDRRVAAHFENHEPRRCLKLHSAAQAQSDDLPPGPFTQADFYRARMSRYRVESGRAVAKRAWRAGGERQKVYGQEAPSHPAYESLMSHP